MLIGLKKSSINASFFLLCLKVTLVQIDILYIHSLIIDYHVPMNSLCCIVFHMLLINQTICLKSETHEFCDVM